jgi:hypothetical protein
MIGILFGYLIVVEISITLMIGLLIPDFANQYQKLVDTHLLDLTI